MSWRWYEYRIAGNFWGSNGSAILVSSWFIYSTAGKVGKVASFVGKIVVQCSTTKPRIFAPKLPAMQYDYSLLSDS